MTEAEFFYWLKGFLAGVPSGTLLTPEGVDTIKATMLKVEAAKVQTIPYGTPVVPLTYPPGVRTSTTALESSELSQSELNDRFAKCGR
jgi:hypothetical protein